ncbi:NAD-dependent epimerase/dehydratase family protein [bacterium]|nr:NAD-dependent epimerase/dehydratase family protein [bacterium]
MNKPEALKYLITGGCGFIGTALVKRINNEQPSAKISVLDNLSVGSREDLAKVCRFEEIDCSKLGLNPEITKHRLVIGDIKDPIVCEKSCRNIDVIVHLAANTGVGPSVENPRFDMEANVIGTLNMLEAAKKQKVARFIFASSGAPIGEVEPPIHEKLAPRPVSPYGASKLAGEGYCSAYYRTFGVKTTALRFGNVYGPGSTHKSSVVAKFIKQTINGELCEIFGDGFQTRDFIYIDDLTEAILKVALFPEFKNNEKLISSHPWGEIFQIATSHEHTVNELAEELKKVLLKYDISMQIVFGEPRLGDVSRNFSDTTKAKNVLDWQAKTSLKDGLEKTVDWFSSEAG